MLEAWRRHVGPAIRVWLDVVGELEAISSLASYRFEHPADVFPRIEQAGPLFEGIDLGHPLLPEQRCVRNSVRLDAGQRLLLVSGSNMSGKSTLLRTVGINAVLALAGAGAPNACALARCSSGPPCGCRIPCRQADPGFTRKFIAFGNCSIWPSRVRLYSFCSTSCCRGRIPTIAELAPKP